MTNEAGPVLIRAGRLIDGTGRPAVTIGSVLMHDGRIVAVGKDDDVRRHPLAHAATEHDAADGTVIPGLIDGHVHLCHLPAEVTTWASPTTRATRSVAAAQQALISGVTTVLDCGSLDGVALDIRDVIRRGLEPGCRILACGPALTTTNGHGEFLGVVADSAPELRSRIRALATRRPNAIKVMATGGSMDPHTNRCRAQYTVGELRAVADEAAGMGVPVVAHANGTEGIRRAVDVGVRVIAHGNFLGPAEGRLEPDQELAARMVRDEVFVDLNVGAAMRPLRESDGWAEPGDSEIPHDRWDLLTGLGLTEHTYFTSDEFGTGVGRFPALLVAAAGAWGLPAEDVVWRASGLPARALQLADRGVLVAGALADVTVLRGDLCAEAGALQRVAAVYLSGRLGAADGQLVAEQRAGRRQ